MILIVSTIHRIWMERARRKDAFLLYDLKHGTDSLKLCRHSKLHHFRAVHRRQQSFFLRKMAFSQPSLRVDLPSEDGAGLKKFRETPVGAGGAAAAQGMRSRFLTLVSHHGRHIM